MLHFWKLVIAVTNLDKDSIVLDYTEKIHMANSSLFAAPSE
jgi:hypothetical protein